MVTIFSVGPNVVVSFQDARGRKNQTLGFWRAHSDSISAAGRYGAPDTVMESPLGTKLRELTARQEGLPGSRGRLLRGSPAVALKTLAFLRRMTTLEGDFLLQEQSSNLPMVSV